MEVGFSFAYLILLVQFLLKATTRSKTTKVNPMV